MVTVRPYRCTRRRHVCRPWPWLTRRRLLLDRSLVLAPLSVPLGDRHLGHEMARAGAVPVPLICGDEDHVALTDPGAGGPSTRASTGSVISALAGIGPSTWLQGAIAHNGQMSPNLDELRRLRRTRDRMDREYAQPLDVPVLASQALMSPTHFIRRFREAYSETPYSYLMTRRVERAKALLRRGDLTVTDVCFAVGWTSLGSFSTRFTELVGETPSEYRARRHDDLQIISPCQIMVITRPRRTAKRAPQ